MFGAFRRTFRDHDREENQDQLRLKEYDDSVAGTLDTKDQFVLVINNDTNCVIKDDGLLPMALSLSTMGQSEKENLSTVSSITSRSSIDSQESELSFEDEHLEEEAIMGEDPITSLTSGMYGLFSGTKDSTKEGRRTPTTSSTVDTAQDSEPEGPWPSGEWCISWCGSQETIEEDFILPEVQEPKRREKKQRKKRRKPRPSARSRGIAKAVDSNKNQNEVEISRGAPSLLDVLNMMEHEPRDDSNTMSRTVGNRTTNAKAPKKKKSTKQSVGVAKNKTDRNKTAGQSRLRSLISRTRSQNKKPKQESLFSGPPNVRIVHQQKPVHAY